MSVTREGELVSITGDLGDKPPVRKLAQAHEIAEYWASQEGVERLYRVGGDGASFVVDLGEASCFACHWWKEPGFDARSVKEAWALSRTGLERCHLVPHDKGGSGEPDNLILLCPDCHFGVPDCLDPEISLRWAVKYESWTRRAVDKAMREARRAGLDPRDTSWNDLLPGAFDQVEREAVNSPGRWGLAAVFGIVAKRHRGRCAA